MRTARPSTKMPCWTLLPRPIQGLLAKRPADMSVEDFKHLWTMVVSAYIVGGRDYAEDEFINYTDAIGATPEAVAAVIRAGNE